MSFKYQANVMEIFWKNDPCVKDLPNTWQPILAPVSLLQGNLRQMTAQKSTLGDIVIAKIGGFISIPYFESDFENDSFVDADNNSLIQERLLNDLTEYFVQSFVASCGNFLADYPDKDGNLPKDLPALLETQQSFASLLAQELASFQSGLTSGNYAVYFGLADVQQGTMLGSFICEPESFYDSVDQLLTEIRGEE